MPKDVTASTQPAAAPHGEFRASLDKRHLDVQAMFDRVASRYDLTNTVLSAGMDRRWRAATVAAIGATAGERVLDLAAGTGVSSVPIAQSGAMVVPCDLSLGMLSVGRGLHPELGFTAGDALALPFADDTFDAATISFGLRNVDDTVAALTELRRVTRPGGRLVICEFSTPTVGLIRQAYHGVVLPSLPKVAKVFSSNSIAYEYLSDSIRTWHDQLSLATAMIEAGWNVVEWRNLTGGVVALHRARA